VRRLRLGASGAERLCALGAIGACVRPLNFTVRSHLGKSGSAKNHRTLLRLAPRYFGGTGLDSHVGVFVWRNRVRARPAASMGAVEELAGRAFAHRRPGFD